MENEIKVGEFFRTKKGNIFKLDKYWLFNDKYKKIDIVKHSSNLIDIIEERRLCKWIQSNKCNK